MEASNMNNTNCMLNQTCLNTTCFLNDACLNITCFNETCLSTSPKWKEHLFISYKIILTLLLVLIMLAMGCNISLREIWKHLKRPWGVLIGLGCQFVVLPLLAFAAAHALFLKPEYAIGTIIIATCPGGTTSNLFTYWVKGNVSLSVTMTTISTVLAFGMMPLNIWLYTKSWADESARIPYVNIVITLASTIVPVAVGFLITWKSPKAGKIITKIGSVSGLLCIGVSTTIQLVLYPELFQDTLGVWVVCIALPLLGYAFGYTIAFILRQSAAFRRTVGFETGWQNVSTALSVIALSYPKETAGAYSLSPIIYGITMMTEGFFVVAVYKVILKFTKGESVKDIENDQSEKEDKPVANGVCNGHAAHASDAEKGNLMEGNDVNKIADNDDEYTSSLANTHL